LTIAGCCKSLRRLAEPCKNAIFSAVLDGALLIAEARRAIACHKTEHDRVTAGSVRIDRLSGSWS
jgi:hypothetical protein